VEHGVELVQDLLHRPLGVHALLADDILRARDEHRILEHQQLRVEHRCQLRATAGQARANLDELVARTRAAGLEARELGPDPRGRNLVAQHLRALNQDDRASRDDARRDADALQALHTSSPNPDATSATSAFTASRSSMPSAVIVMVDPRAAASSRTPMMLFPSISRASRATRTLA